jgi:putative transposase
LIGWLGLAGSKFHAWRQRYGKANEHNGWVPRDHWLTPAEQAAIAGFARQYPLEGHRRLAFMMLDRDVAAASPATVYRVLKRAGLVGQRPPKSSGKGQGFVQPLAVHEHWHIDIAYLNLRGTFYYLCSLLDGRSRAIVHWEIRESMTEAEVQTIVQRARERFPEARPRIISDNGPQFIAKDFKEFIRLAGMTHVRISPHYPQSNGKLERFHRTLKSECIRPQTPLSLADARRVVADFVRHYNQVRLHSALGYVAPADVLEGRHQAILAARDRKLEAARAQRALLRQQQRTQAAATTPPPATTPPRHPASSATPPAGSPPPPACPKAPPG